MTILGIPSENSNERAWDSGANGGLYALQDDSGKRPSSTMCMWESHESGGMEKVEERRRRQMALMGEGRDMARGVADERRWKANVLNGIWSAMAAVRIYA